VSNAIVLSTRDQWATAIRTRWSGAVESFLETGRLLNDAKEKLPHGDFEAMVETDLPFGPRTARMLMAIARNPVLSNRKHASVLPPSWDTLYRLSRLSEDRLLAAIESGEVTPETERRAAIRLLASMPSDLPSVTEESTAPNHSALCLRDFGDGRICREGVAVLDSRVVRDENGRAKQVRVVECPVCGLRLQARYDEGPTEKRYVAERVRILPDVLG